MSFARPHLKASYEEMINKIESEQWLSSEMRRLRLKNGREDRSEETQDLGKGGFP